MFKRQYIKELEGTIDSLKVTINNLEDDIYILKTAIKERDKMITVEFNKNKKLQNRITDLENNIDFLYDNLSSAKKKQINKEAPCAAKQ